MLEKVCTVDMQCMLNYSGIGLKCPGFKETVFGIFKGWLEFY
jgi:hypothetical protein